VKWGEVMSGVRRSLETEEMKKDDDNVRKNEFSCLSARFRLYHVAT